MDGDNLLMDHLKNSTIDIQLDLDCKTYGYPHVYAMTVNLKAFESLF